MKINYIKYHNYRCFKDLCITFETTSDKNIALVLGVNGSGKTEMLFSFQWVLYGFDFKNLREKEDTAYSLNASMYHTLSTNRHSNSIDCWVEMSFTYNDTEYFVKRTETFMRNNNKIESKINVELSHTEKNGERTTPERNRTIVEEFLSRIIPKSILEGITFDGERMKKLNVAEQSKDTIKNVISLVTNEKLFDLCTNEIKDVNKDVQREITKINQQIGNKTAESLSNEIENLEQDIEDIEISLRVLDKQLIDTNHQLDEISLKFSQIETARELEQKRKGLEKDLKTATRNLDLDIDAFFKRLSDGYSLATDKLVADVKTSLENIDVPSGLTAEAVRSILKRDKCICGSIMNSEIQKVLTDMLATLPPDNISSTLLYMANQFENEKIRSQKLLTEAYTNMKNREEEVAKIKIDLSEVSTSLIEDVSQTARELETSRNKLNQNIGRITSEQKRLSNLYEKNQKRFNDAKKELSSISSYNEELTIHINKKEILNLFRNAIIKIGERNSQLSLLSINDNLSKSYSILSEDSGRRLYICQFDKNDKYRLVTYLEKEFIEKKTSWINEGKTNTLAQDGLTEDEIIEKIILEVAAGKSTGQSKINSLAFAKAILDYSNEDRRNDNLKISHNYPFLIDSPFTELSGDNLINIGKNINTFAEQIILMADDNSYEDVKQFVEPYVSKTTRLLKDKNNGITYIK